METIRITEDNIDEYEDVIDADAAENIGREYFRGIAIQKDEDSEPEATLIWEYKNLEEDTDTVAEITWCSVKNQKIGKELFDAYTAEIEDCETTRSFYELASDSDSLKKAFTSAGFSAEVKEGRDVVITVGELAECLIAKKKVPPYITGIGELMVRQFRKGITNCVFHGRKGLLEDLEFLPMSWYDEDVSCCVQTDGKVNGFLLVNKRANGDLVVDFLFALEPDARVNLIYMIRYAINMAVEKYPEDTRVVLRRHNEMTRALVEKLFPGKKGETVLAGERRED